MSLDESPKRRRPYMTHEVRTAAKLYADPSISVREMSERLDRSTASVHFLLSKAPGIKRRRPGMARQQAAIARRNAKIIEGLLMGDSWTQVMRRWEISEHVLYGILYTHKERTGMSHTFWRCIFFCTKSGIS